MRFSSTLQRQDRVAAVIPVYPPPEVVALRSRETRLAPGRHWIGWFRARHGRRLAHLGTVEVDPLAPGPAFTVASGVPPEVSWLDGAPATPAGGLRLYLHDGARGAESDVLP